ncbi:putative transporter subunit: permease component of ABC superfamily [Syntrophobacter sp. SbD1]|nr:putative transporter subunit: permease component of ABC superfamily [Syntrophobacter sp. SbD1]
MESLRRIATLIWKELWAILKDPRSRFTVIGPPILQALIFGYAATYDLNQVRYAVYDQDRSEASRQFLADMDGSGTFRRVANLRNQKEIGPLIDSKTVLLVVQIGQDFERRLLSGQPADLQVVADGRNSNTAGTALNYIGTITDSFNARWQQAHGGLPPPVQTVPRAWYNPNLETRWYMVPGMIGMLTLVQMVIITAMSVAREREQGTFDQLLVTPFRPIEIMIGKSVPSILIGLVQVTMVLTLALFWFKIPFQGSLAILYFGVLLFLIAAVGIGLMVSSLAATMQQALLGSFLTIMPFAMLSGLNTPIANMPQNVQYITLINPLRYVISIIHRVFLEAASLSGIASDMWPLALIALCSLSIAAWMFRRRLV